MLHHIPTLATPPPLLQLICDFYTVPKTASSEVMEFGRFLDDVDVIFTKKVRAVTGA